MTYECADIEPVFTGYSDADLAGWHNGRSRTGWCIKFGAPLDKTAMTLWQCKLQVPIFDNTPDSEQAALMELGHNLFWFRNLANDCGLPQPELTQAFVDNKPTIQRTENPARWRRKRKVHIVYFKTVEYCNEDSHLRIIDLHHIPGDKNPADYWTKITRKEAETLGMRMVIMNLKSKWG